MNKFCPKLSIRLADGLSGRLTNGVHVTAGCFYDPVGSNIMRGFRIQNQL